MASSHRNGELLNYFITFIILTSLANVRADLDSDYDSDDGDEWDNACMSIIPVGDPMVGRVMRQAADQINRPGLCRSRIIEPDSAGVRIIGSIRRYYINFWATFSNMIGGETLIRVVAEVDVKTNKIVIISLRGPPASRRATAK